VDLRLGEVDGTQIISSLRGLAPQMRILAMSAFPEPDEVRAAVQAGASEVLHKPLERDMLLRTLERELAALGIHGHTEQEFNRRLGQRLRALRQAQQRTLSDVAARAHITAAQLSQIELGKNATSTWTLARICGALQVPVARVFEAGGVADAAAPALGGRAVGRA
jgi:DNA-binding NtrC family response regulator